MISPDFAMPFYLKIASSHKRGEYLALRSGRRPPAATPRSAFQNFLRRGIQGNMQALSPPKSSPPERIKPLQGIFYSPAFAVPSTPPAINMASPFLTLGVKQPIFAYPFVLIHLYFTGKWRGSQGHHALSSGYSSIIFRMSAAVLTGTGLSALRKPLSLAAM